MHGHGGKSAVDETLRRIILVGNPNVGKSVIFGILTGRYVTVSNYPGTTVEVSQGNATVGGTPSLVVDTPGVNSLIPMSEDERVTRDMLMAGNERVVLQVADAKNLRRSLLITVQLAEMGVPLVVALNMDDEARSRGITVDAKALGKIIGAPVTPTVATSRSGIGPMTAGLKTTSPAAFHVDYGPTIERAIARISGFLPDAAISARSLSLMLLAGDESLRAWLRAEVSDEQIRQIEEVTHGVQREFNHPLGYVIGRARLKAIDAVVSQVVTREERLKSSFAEAIGRWSMHWLYGIPIMLAVLVATYFIVGDFAAGTCVNFLENTVFGAPGKGGWIVPWLESTISGSLGREGVGGFFRDMLVGEYGVFTMALPYAIALVLPIVTFFFLVFGFLEDSGYMPRLAVMVNKWFKMIGLNGKAVLPMVLGLGCDTMATMTARILPSRKERILVTLLLALGVPCSAQLGVQAAILADISLTALLVWVSIIVGVLFAVGWIAARILPGSGSDFVLEVPPIRMPTLGNIVTKTLARVEWYLKEAMPLFIYGTLLLFFMDKIPINSEMSLLQGVGKIGGPVVEGLLDLPADTAPAFILGFLRRDYGVVFASRMGLTNNQILVAGVTLTLFIPCVANLLIMIKERGMKTALWMVAFIIPFAFLVGGAVNLVLKLTGAEL